MIDPTEADIGRAVTYVPYHAHDDLAHKDCEHGIITSFNDHYVFVRYNGKGLTSQATKRDQLVWQS